jgi:diguanylate cyclase (GGDEF)-like protein
VLALLLVCARLCAQEYSFRVLGNAEGLSNLTVRSLYQDSVGFLWVSTSNGIFRYDGDRFESFGPAQGIPSNDMATFGDAPDGSLLVMGGFGLYHLRGNRFEKLNESFRTTHGAQGIASDGKGHTYLGTDVGLIELSQDGRGGFAARTFPPPSGSVPVAAHAVLVDGESLWYGCGRQLCRVDADRTRTWGQKSGFGEALVLSIRKDRNGAIWTRGDNGSLRVLTPGQSEFQRPALPLSGRPANALSVDSDGRIQLLYPEALLIQQGKRWRRVNRQSGMRGVPVALYEDRQRTLWIGLEGRGLAQWIGYQEWESYSTESGLTSDLIFAILPHNGVLWVGGQEGLMRGERQGADLRWRPVPGATGFHINALLAAPDGSIWIGAGRSGVTRLDPRTGRITWLGAVQGLRNNTVYSLLLDRQKRLWVGADTGLFVSRAPYQHFERVNELPFTSIWTLAEGSDGVLWAGGLSGLFALDGERWRIFGPRDGMSHQEVLSLGADADGSMWIGYRLGGGIDRVRLQASGLAVEKAVQRPGSDGIIYFLEFDAQRRLWVGTEHGVDLWDGHHWSHYDTGDGLIWNDCNQHAFAQEPDGTVWIGTSGGLSHFKPRPHDGAETPVEVVFTQLIVGRMDVSGQVDPSFGVRANSLIAHYAALNALRKNGVLFRYRLVGAHSSWTETPHRELQFAELAPGAYRLEVEARDSDGAWSGRTAQFAFRILSPWYLSWWFWTLCALFPVAVAGGIFRWRMNSVALRERALQRLVKAHEEIRNLAFYDPLTGLPNRRQLLERLTNILSGNLRGARLRALLLVDLDDFKTLNDTLGHQTGDLLLQEVAQRLSTLIREADTVARLGSDEFVLILKELSEQPQVAATQAESIAEKILFLIGQPYMLAGRECLSTSSIGIALFGDRQESANEVLQQTDIALHQAKKVGRGNVRFFAPVLQVAVNARATLEEELRQAIKNNQFVLYYQPQVDRGLVAGAEALIRWQHPQRGLLLPGEFISQAEETGLILPLGDWVLEAVCRQIAEWTQRKKMASISIAANISARQFRQPNFVARVLSVLRSSGASSSNLKLELTESMMVDNIEEVIAKMTELKAHGLRFSLDDFGTGYSSLSYLKRLPLEQLKIDRAFVRDILTDASSGAIAQTVISLSRALKLSVLAEGVETEEQRDYLIGLGCQAFQGYLFSRPLPAADFERWLPNLDKAAKKTG